MHRNRQRLHRAVLAMRSTRVKAPQQNFLLNCGDCERKGQKARLRALVCALIGSTTRTARHGMALNDINETREQGCPSVISSSEHRAQGAASREPITQVMPDLARAAKQPHPMSAPAPNVIAGPLGMDAVAPCVVVLDHGCKILHTNSAAQRELAAGVFKVRHGCIVASDAGMQAHLVRAVALATSEPSSGRAHASVVRMGHERADRLCSVLPLHAHHRIDQAPDAKPQALLLWSGSRLLPDASQLSAVLRVSGSEARLALVLAAGHTVKAFARLQDCSLHTARTHLKNLMRKTGCSRQVELVQLINSLRLD